MCVLQCQTFVIHIHRPSPHCFIVTHYIKTQSKDKRLQEERVIHCLCVQCRGY